MSAPDSFIRVEQRFGSRLSHIGDILWLGEPRATKARKHCDTQRKDICALQHLIQLLPPGGSGKIKISSLSLSPLSLRYRRGASDY